jgi:hypothetical protein
MPLGRGDQFQRAQALAERYRPLLILYPEVSSRIRRKHPNWRKLGGPPVCEDYHPRDVRLVLDHARIRHSRAPHDAEQLLRELERNPATARIDILEGAYPGQRNKFWAAYYDIVNKIGDHKEDETYPLSAYVNVVYGDELASDIAPNEHAADYRGLIAIDYWFIYFYNHWVSVHEGDWEHVLVVVKEDADPEGQPEPIACAYSVHDIGYRLPWRDVHKVNDQRERTHQGTHPVVYVANGSHANYFFGDRPYPAKVEVLGYRIRTRKLPWADYTTSFRDGVKVFPELRVVPPLVDGRWEGEWRWLNFTGRWGSRGPGWLPRVLQIGCLRGIQEAPESLPPRRNWRNPFEWIDRRCEDAQVLDTWLAGQGRLV